MSLLKHLRKPVPRLQSDESGAMPIEGLIGLLFLIWWYFASYQYFDAFRQKNINLKAAYTIADMLSRETGPSSENPAAPQIDVNYVNGLNKLFDYMTFSNKPTWIRVSSVYFDDGDPNTTDDDQYSVDWSVTSGVAGAHPTLTDVTLRANEDRIPVLPNGGTLIVVETFMAHEPVWYYKGTPEYSTVNGQQIEVIRMFDSGLEPLWMSTFITTAPRYASCIPWETRGCGTDAAGEWTGVDDPDPEVDDDPDT